MSINTNNEEQLQKNKWWLYLLSCEHKKTYTGITVDVEKRFADHITGKGAKFTRSNKPIKILAAQPFLDRSSVSKAESWLKKQSRPNKLIWAKQWAWGKPVR